MKHIGLIVLGLVFVLSSCSYEPGVSDAMMKYRFREGVTTLTIPGWAINWVAGLNELDETEQEIFESIDKVKIIAVDDADLNARINLHDEFYSKVNKDGYYEELFSAKDDSESVTVFARLDNMVVKEMVILVGGDDNAMVYVKGSFSPELLKDKMNEGEAKKLLSFNF